MLEVVIVAVVVFSAALTVGRSWYLHARRRRLSKAADLGSFEAEDVLPTRLLPALPRPSRPGRRLGVDRPPSSLLERLDRLVRGQAVSGRAQGEIDGYPAWVFDVAEADRGLGRPWRPRSSCVVIDTDRSWPWLWAEQVCFSTRVREAAGAAGQETGHPAFDEQYYLRSACPAGVEELLNDSVRACLLDCSAGPVSVFVHDRLVMVASRGHVDHHELLTTATTLISSLLRGDDAGSGAGAESLAEAA